MAIITNIDDATSALKIVITQGEGAMPGEPVTSGILSHYQVFETLHEHELDCYDIVEDPVTSEFQGLKVHPVSPLYPG